MSPSSVCSPAILLLHLSTIFKSSPIAWVDKYTDNYRQLKKVQIFYLTSLCRKERKPLSPSEENIKKKEKTQKLFLVTGCQHYFRVNWHLQNSIVIKYEYDLASTYNTFTN